MAYRAIVRILQIVDIIQITARVADDHVSRITNRFRQHVTKEEVNVALTGAASDNFDPEEILHRRHTVSVHDTASHVEITDARAQIRPELRCGLPIRRQVDVIELLADDPPCHWIDVMTYHLAAQPVGFENRRATAHERISDLQPSKVVRLEVGVLQRPITKFGKKQGAKQGSRTVRELLVHRDNRAVVLLNLLLSQGEVGNK